MPVASMQGCRNNLNAQIFAIAGISKAVDAGSDFATWHKLLQKHQN